MYLFERMYGLPALSFWVNLSPFAFPLNSSFTLEHLQQLRLKQCSFDMFLAKIALFLPPLIPFYCEEWFGFPVGGSLGA